jgi:5-methylthioadenosine/S-adenosylhomocysteine deaminase
MLDRGIVVGIGTDAANTSDTQNMFEATRLAAYLSRLATPVALTGRVGLT